MPKYVIERELAGAGILTPEQLQGIAQKSCGVLQKLGPQIQWLESYVTDDKIYCVYVAPDVATVREHATQGGFPANRVSAVTAVIDPRTAGALPGPGSRTLVVNARQKKMTTAARQPRRWLWPGLVAGAAILALAIVTLKDSRWIRQGPRAQAIQREEPTSPLAWQSRIWKEGFAVGERYVQEGGTPLGLDAIDEKSFAKFPTDFTADVLWSAGFEAGQIHATHRQ